MKIAQPAYPRGPLRGFVFSRFNRRARLLIPVAGLVAGLCLSACQQTPLVGPAVTIRYHQVGACNGIGTTGAGSNHAFVVFAIDKIDNTVSGIPFSFDPHKLYAVTNGEQDTLDPMLPAAMQTLGSQQIPKVINPPIPAGAAPTFGNQPFAMMQVPTLAANGAWEANHTSYFLNYNSGSGDPPIVLAKLNPGRGLWPYTNSCQDISLGTGNFLYAAAYLDDHFLNTAIIPVRVDSIHGTLTVGATVPTPNEYGVISIAIEPSARFLYSVGIYSISTFAIDQVDGHLTKIGGDIGPGGDIAVVEPSGNFLYVLGEGSFGEGSVISTYKIDQPSGTLTSYATTQLSGPHVFLAVAPSGRSLYTAGVLGSGDNSGETVSISGFAIAQMCQPPQTCSPQQGALTPIPPNLDLPPTYDTQITADQGGAFLYVAGSYGPSTVTGFSIDPQTGALASLAAQGSPWTVGANPAVIETDLYGAYLFAATLNGIQRLAITQSGSLSNVQTFPPGGSNWAGFAVDRTGSFLYGLPAASGPIVGYSIGYANGTLTPVGQTPINGVFPALYLEGSMLTAAGTIQ